MRQNTRIPAAVVTAIAALAAGCDAKIDVSSSVTDGEFTSAKGENQIRLTATVSRLPEDSVRWSVERGLGDQWTKVTLPNGPEVTLEVKSPGGASRYKTPHPSTDSAKERRAERQRIRYRIVAMANRKGKTVQSDTLRLEQSLIAAIRQEYLDIGLKRGAPPRQWFGLVANLPPSSGQGDFGMGAASPDFVSRLEQLAKIWKEEYQLNWQINSYYRNPAHNRYHVGGSGSGPVSNSWHQFGCAADIQTYPILVRGRSRKADTVRARQFWDALAEEALALDFEIEPRDKNPANPGASYSGVGHLHIEMDCIE